MWIDVHAHLYELDNSALRHALDEARRASVTAIVNTATDLNSSRAVADQCARSGETLFAAVGISCFEAATTPEDWATQLQTIINEAHPIALGELGLDFTNPRYPPKDLQIRLLEQQLELALEYTLPAVVHSRGAEKEVLQVCRSMSIPRVLFHCFTGDHTAMRAIVDSGYSLSLSGIVTFKNAAIRELTAQIPPENLLIETDTPYLAPVPHRGKPNQPAWLAYTGIEIARLRNTSPESLAAQLKDNFDRLFKPSLAALTL